MQSFFAMDTGTYDPAANAGAYLHVNNFGYYRDLNSEVSVSRPMGRADYQLLFAASGKIRLRDRTLECGEMYLFAPGEEQCYAYLPEKNAFYYWVHFTGWGADQILKGFLAGRRCFTVGTADDEIGTLWRLMNATLRKKGESTPYVASLLAALLCRLTEPPMSASPFRRAVKLLEDPQETCSIAKLAEMYRMTPAHFIRSFKSAYGVPPANYRTRRRIAQGRQLLASTELSVAQVAELCGFSDALYFSRVFKAQTGRSPSAYRNQEEHF